MRSTRLTNHNYRFEFAGRVRAIALASHYSLASVCNEPTIIEFRDILYFLPRNPCFQRVRLFTDQHVPPSSERVVCLQYESRIQWRLVTRHNSSPHAVRYRLLINSIITFESWRVVNLSTSLMLVLLTSLVHQWSSVDFMEIKSDWLREYLNFYICTPVFLH